MAIWRVERIMEDKIKQIAGARRLKTSSSAAGDE